MMIEPLRGILVLGLVLHKLIWEWLKRGRPHYGRAAERGARGAPLPRVKQIVKLAKVGVLAFLVIQTLWLDVLPITAQPDRLRWIGLCLYLIGLLIAVLGRIELGRNWVDIEDGKVLDNQELVDTGIYRYIRHPIYTGDILLLIGLELALNSWLVVLAGVPLAVVVRRVLIEEAVLARAFPRYVGYQKRTKRFIPFVI